MRIRAGVALADAAASRADGTLPELGYPLVASAVLAFGWACQIHLGNPHPTHSAFGRA
jgi:hypothetical protein